MVITQNGKPTGVVLSPEDYDELIYQKTLIDSINKGLEDVEKGNVFSTEQLKAELKKRRT